MTYRGADHTEAPTLESGISPCQPMMIAKPRMPCQPVLIVVWRNYEHPISLKRKRVHLGPSCLAIVRYDTKTLSYVMSSRNAYRRMMRIPLAEYITNLELQGPSPASNSLGGG